jgi:hypothetical protein
MSSGILLPDDNLVLLNIITSFAGEILVEKFVLIATTGKKC